MIVNGDCYFTRECEALGVPLLCTPVPSFKEQGLVEGQNCYYIPFEVDNIDINKIVNNIPEYEGYIKEDGWKEILVKSKSKYNQEQKDIKSKKSAQRGYTPLCAIVYHPSCSLMSCSISADTLLSRCCAALLSISAAPAVMEIVSAFLSAFSSRTPNSAM